MQRTSVKRFVIVFECMWIFKSEMNMLFSNEQEIKILFHI